MGHGVLHVGFGDEAVLAEEDLGDGKRVRG